MARLAPPKKILHCNCGLPPENHFWSDTRGAPIGFGPTYANEGYHYKLGCTSFCNCKWLWGPRPRILTSSIWSLLTPDGVFNTTPTHAIDEAHNFCNTACALFTLAPSYEGAGSRTYIYDRLYAAWFHHAQSDTRRGQFLVERLECSEMEELNDTRRPDDLELQTALVVKALLPIHAQLCRVVEQTLASSPAGVYINPDEDEFPDDEPASDQDGDELEFEDDYFYTEDEDQIGRTYTDRDAWQATRSIMTSHLYHLSKPEEFPFKPSFKEYFLVHDEADFRSKGVTLVRLGGPPPGDDGKKWKFDETTQVAWWRDDIGVILERFLELIGLPPSDFPDIMHGRISSNVLNPALGFRVEEVK